MHFIFEEFSVSEFLTFERRNFNVYLGIFVIVSDPTEIGIV